jgi:hypothetical protein
MHLNIILTDFISHKTLRLRYNIMYSETRTKYTNTSREQDAEYFNVLAGDIQSGPKVS